MFRGFATLNFYAADLDAAAAWYTEIFGIDPYYRVPGYIEFRIGDSEDEFGIIDAAYAPSAPSTPGGSIMHWHVDNLDATLELLLANGATAFQPITKHGNGDGFITASVVDPFGNILGIMHNEHYLEVLDRQTTAVAVAAE